MIQWSRFDMFSDVLEIFPDSTINVSAKKNLTRIQKCCLVLHLAAFICGATVLALFLWEHPDLNSPEYRLDTDHLRWRTAIPAVSVCERPDSTAYSRHLAPRTVSANNLTQVAEFLNGLIIPERRYCINCERPCSHCPKANYKMHVDKATRTCGSLFKKCIWDGTEFDCCKNFKLLVTKDGKCFTVNSQQVDGTTNIAELFLVSREQRGIMKLTLNVLAKIYLHDSKNVDFMQQPSKQKKNEVQSPKTKTKGEVIDIIYRYYEIRGDSSAWSLTAAQRKCVMSGERVLEHHRVYSRSACRAECRARRQLAVCNCTHHLLPRPDGRQPCDLEGLKCLDHHFKDRLKETRRKLKRMKIACGCPPECDTTDINVVRQIVTGTEEDETFVTITLQSPPTQRLTLTARVSWLDVLVCIACFSRLFTSASLPSVCSTLVYIGRRIHYRRAKTLAIATSRITSPPTINSCDNSDQTDDNNL